MLPYYSFWGRNLQITIIMLIPQNYVFLQIKLVLNRYLILFLLVISVTPVQIILTVFGEKFGIDPETAKKLGRGFGGGIGRQAMTCGALTGAVMVFGFAFYQVSESKAKTTAYKAVRKLFAQFKQQHGTTEYLGLLGAHVGTKEGMQRILALHHQIRPVCGKYHPQGLNRHDRLFAETFHLKVIVF